MNGAFGSLRARLIVSHVAVIALAFVLTIAVAFVPVRRSLARQEQDRLLTVADTLATQADALTRPDGGTLRAELLQALATRQARVTSSRLLLARADGTIALDSRPAATDIPARPAGLADDIQRLRELARAEGAAPGAVPRAVSIPIGRIAGHQAVLATTTSAVARDDALYVVALSPRRRLPVLAGVLRPLALAGGLAVLVGVVASVLLARSISGPLTRVTTAAGAIRAGDDAARLPGEGDDEVGTLVRAFNATLQRLATTYASQRALLANIAHELRTPLTSIQGYAQALRDDVAPRDEALAVIGDEAERMGELVNQILQLARLESGELPLRREPVALAPLLERLRRGLAPLARERAVTLTADAPEGLAVPGDPELLTQALSNLAVNALRHTPDGGRVALSAERAARAGQPPLTRVHVTDTGPGIPADELARIFDRFYRGPELADAPADAARPRRYGLGLAIAREIAARHGGTLSVASEPGRGTTFTLELPEVAPA